MNRHILWILILLMTITIIMLSNQPVRGEEKITAPDGTVTLPLQSFLNLTRKPVPNGPARTPGENLPVKYIFTGGSYTVFATGQNARVDGQISLTVYQSGWVDIPLLKKNMAISSATLDGRELPLFVKDEMYHFMARGVGEHTIRVSFYVNASKEGGTTRVVFNVPQTTVSNISASVPLTKAQVTVSPAIIRNQYEKGDRTVVEATLPSTDGDLTVSWTPKAVIPALVKAQKKEKPRLYGTVQNLLSVRQDAIHMTSVISYSILFNQVRQLSFTVPKDVTIINMSGASFVNWEKKEEKDVNVITALLSTGVEGSYQLTVEYEKPVAKINSTWAVPMLQLLGVERQSGSIGCFSEDNIEISMAGLQGASQIDEKDLSLELRSKASRPIMHAFKYQAVPCQISLETRKLEEVPVLATTIDTARAITVVNDEGNAVTTITYEMRNNQKQYMDLVLPARSRLLGSFVNNLPVKPVKGAGDTVKIPLLKSKGEGGNDVFSVEITYITEMGGFSGITVKTAPAPQCNIPVSSFYWSFYLPQDQRVMKFGGTMKLMSESDVQLSVSRPATDSAPAAPKVELREKDCSEKITCSTAAPRRADIEKQKAFEGSTIQRIDTIVSAGTKGLNPVKIYIPQVGRLYRFSKMLVIDRSPQVVAYFYQGWIYSMILVASFALIVTIGMVLVHRSRAGRNGALAFATVLALFIARPHIGEFFGYGLLAVFVVFLYWLWISRGSAVMDFLKLRAHRSEPAAS